MRYLLVFYLLLVGMLPACMGSGRAKLADSVRDYNTRLRWNDMQGALKFVSPKIHKEFMAAHQSQEPDLDINDIEVTSLAVDESKEEALVKVVLTWHRRSQGLVYTTVVMQSWERGEAGWQLQAEERASGEPLSWLP